MGNISSTPWIIAAVIIVKLVIFCAVWVSCRKPPTMFADPIQSDIEQNARRNDEMGTPNISVLPTAPTSHAIRTSNISTDQPPSYDEIQVQPNPPASLNDCGFYIPPPQYPNCVPIPQTHTGYRSR